MSDLKEAAVVALLGPILDAWANRNRRKAAQDAGALTFWRDGMLEHLQTIADKKATPRTFGSLRRQYDKTARGVDKASTKLRRARQKLAGTALAEQIDMILHHDDVGKMTIREEIGQLLRTWDYAKTLPPGHEDAKMMERNIAEEAEYLCRVIKHFNSEVQRLRRMVS